MSKAVSYLVFGFGFLVATGIGYSATSTSVEPAFDMSAADTHWAFIPLVKPEVPVVDRDVSINVMDAFILHKLKEHGLSLNARADKRTLIRRVTYDLTGLPPTFEDVETFLADESPEAYTHLVDRLLASPSYGERWARHWLDVARYADTKGIFKRGRYSFSYTYRDYVIRSFNEDKPYDQFILEQIAADQLDLGEDKSALAAMGFLTLGRTFFGRKDFIIDDQIDVITRGLQGLTVTCARCHDHKFDPIPTADYYSLHGIFASSLDPEILPVIQHPEDEDAFQAYLEEKKRLEREIEIKSDEVIDTFLVEERSLAGDYLRAVDEGKTITDEEDFKVFAGSKKVQSEILRLWIDFLENEDNRTHPVLLAWFNDYGEGDQESGVAFYNEQFTAAAKEEDESSLEIRAFFMEPGTPLNPDREEIAKWIKRRIGGDTGDLTGELQALDWTHPGAPMRAHILEDVSSPKNSSVYNRGDPANLGEEVPRQYLQILSGSEREPFSVGSGRLELARAIADENNPLTARVFVNRVWGWHMGKEIVDTPSDFGVRTPEPEHIDLLNWLAASFIDSGWSIKALHRLIVLSRTYQQSSASNPDGLLVDSGNLLWHYFPKARLDFESMRDTLLAVAGNLDRTIGGIPVDITDPTTNRRTIYSYIDRQDMPGIFRTFDHPSPEASSPGRFETVVPQQALFLMNSPFTIEQSKHLSERISQIADDDERIRQLYRVVYQRDPAASELRDGTEFVRNAKTLSALDAAPLQESESIDEETSEEAVEPLNEWSLYAQVLLLSNELIFID
ncbi:MAG: DUF1549 and DUF1553 domain-containing protein [Verrucomicrobia bacterium]|nr:DUF1549 and DUF1553 domain-containing protein [Verrucomicrobiota bacterium]